MCSSVFISRFLKRHLGHWVNKDVPAHVQTRTYVVRQSCAEPFSFVIEYKFKATPKCFELPSPQRTKGEVFACKFEMQATDPCPSITHIDDRRHMMTKPEDDNDVNDDENGNEDETSALLMDDNQSQVSGKYQFIFIEA